MEETESVTRSPLWSAMLEVQKELRHAIKDSKNPHLGNRYASLGSVLDAIKPVANKHGLVIAQLINAARKDYFGDSIIVKTVVAHAMSGESVSDEQLVPLPKKAVKVKNDDGTQSVDWQFDPQSAGSAITYGRRYGLSAMFAISAEDDDGNAAGLDSRPSQKPPEKALAPKQEDVERKLSTALGFSK